MRPAKLRDTFSIFVKRALLPILLGGTICLAADRPNILWLTSEDHGPHLGAYGDDYADTPNLDVLARRGMLYRNAWSTAPVCAPARTAIISGVYPPSSGAHHMRSRVRLPGSMKLYPQYLRESGYYCSNNVKEDYNVEKPGRVWDESSREAHWRKRGAEQPFFAVFNFTESHESQIRRRPHKLQHDPAKVRVPAYHPDTPEVRLDWAQYYDKVTEVDALAGKVLKELAADGLAEETIVFFYADHGPGMPRGKRWTYNSGLHVPLIIYVPEKYHGLAGPGYKPGGESDRLVGFIDLAPTVLSLAGIQPPKHFQGGAFLGPHAAPAPDYQFAFRDRMDERYDMTRAVRDRRYLYVRNYKPHKRYGQHVDYMFKTPTTRVWHALFKTGKLNAAQSRFWKTKPAEELYDIEADPDEIRNLADSPRGRPIARRLREVLGSWQSRIRDLGFLPEGEIHSRSRGMTPYEAARDAERYPYEAIARMADIASSLRRGVDEELGKGLRASDSAVRYWAALGILMRGREAVCRFDGGLRDALVDPSPFVRTVAAQALGVYGNDSDAEKALAVLLELAHLERNGLYVSVAALNAIDAMDQRAQSAAATIAALPTASPAVDDRMGHYVSDLIRKTLADFE